MTDTQNIAAAADVRAIVSAASAAASREIDKLAKLENLQRRERAQRSRLISEEESDAAIRQLDGLAAAPKDPVRVKTLATLEENIPARETAIGLQKRRIADAHAECERLRPQLVAAVLALTEEMQDSAVAETHTVLASVAPPMSHLIAADQIRAATVGDKFPLPTGVSPPFSGLAVVRNFLRATPDRLRPPELSEGALVDAAHKISAAIISQITGEN